MTKIYPSYDEIRGRRIAARRHDALRVLNEVDAKAHAAGGRVLVFGSLAEGGFDDRSDIDVALMGVPSDRDLQVAADIDTAISLAGFPADVVLERFLPASLRERIMRHGREPGALG